MFTPTRRWIALCTTSLMRESRRSVGTQTTGVLLATAKPAGHHDATAQPQNTKLLSNLKTSLSNLLGEAVVGDAADSTLGKATCDKTLRRHAMDVPQSNDTPSMKEAESLSLPPYYKPMDLRQVLYEGEMAERLCAAAELQGFRSPVWGTELSLTRSGYTIKGGETGVDVCTAMGTVALFNLEQTSATDAVICNLLKSCKATTTPSPNPPLTAAGRPHRWRVRQILQDHPLYHQYKSPYWVSESEAAALGTAVSISQLECGVVIPFKMPLADSREEITEEAFSSPTSSGWCVLYNAEQLEKPEMVTSETCAPVTCVNVHGRLYSPLLTVHMRQYCRQHNLRTEPLATFITAGRLRALGGELLSTEDVPPPLSFVLNGEILSLYHVDQTTMAEKLLHQTLTRRSDWLSCKRATGMWRA